MTFIQPNKNKFFFNKTVLAFLAATLCCVLWIVVLYYQTVNLEHDIVVLRTELEDLETKSADTKQEIFSLFEGSDVDAFAREHGLVKEKSPTYLEVYSWLSASH